jgi:hypothetical protein
MLRRRRTISFRPASTLAVTHASRRFRVLGVFSLLFNSEECYLQCALLLRLSQRITSAMGAA